MYRPEPSKQEGPRKLRGLQLALLVPRYSNHLKYPRPSVRLGAYFMEQGTDFDRVINRETTLANSNYPDTSVRR